LVDGVPERPSIGHYVEILKERGLRRAAVLIGRRLVDQAGDPGDSIQDALAGTHEDVLRLQGDAQEKTLAPLAEITGTVLGNIERMMSYDPYGTIGVPFGLTELDEATTGMREGHLVVLGGFPKSGKTSFAVDTVRKAAKGGLPVGFFSREMLKEELVERLLTQESDVPYAKIRRPMNLSVSDFRLLERTKTAMDAWPLYIDDEATHIAQMLPRAHLMIRKHKVRLLVFDYIQILGAPGDKEYERVSYVASALASLAKKTKVPILALSQLTHPEGRKGDMNIMPNMSMLRSSGQIAQDANLILFTYHPMDKQTGDPTGEDLVIVGAQRSGPTGRIKTFFQVQNQRWEPRGVAATPAPKQEAMFANSTKGDDF
jgi:replicative DNA helicase